jgi:hypothetical protein
MRPICRGDQRSPALRQKRSKVHESHDLGGFRAVKSSFAKVHESHDLVVFGAPVHFCTGRPETVVFTRIGAPAR